MVIRETDIPTFISSGEIPSVWMCAMDIHLQIKFKIRALRSENTLGFLSPTVQNYFLKPSNYWLNPLLNALQDSY